MQQLINAIANASAMYAQAYCKHNDSNIFEDGELEVSRGKEDEAYIKHNGEVVAVVFLTDDDFEYNYKLTTNFGETI